MNRAAGPGAPGKPAKKSNRHAPGEGPAKVLLAEDEESFVEALVIGLTNEGFRVTVARDGIEALELFGVTGPDIVLLDLMLPKMSGIDVCRAIRVRSQVPIIMVTAKGAEIDTVVALEVGADDYVTKPYRLRELVARMRAVLRRAPGGTDGSDSGSLEFGTEGVWDSNGVTVDFDQQRDTSCAATKCTCGARSSSCCACWSRTRAVSSPATSSSTASGAPTTSGTPRPSTCTSSDCARA